MPTYSYKCTACGNAFDTVQSITDDSLTVCPSCGGALRKVFGLTGVTFNGSGFYRTDSRASSTSGGSGDKKGASTSSGGGASPSSAPAAS